jgi:hypothetical protein
MGRYIQGPSKGKVMFIVSEYDGKVWAPDPMHPTRPPLWGDKPEGMEWVIVVDNGPFEAAGWLFDQREFDDFQDPEDNRPKRYLLVPTERIKELFPEFFKTDVKTSF